MKEPSGRGVDVGGVTQAAGDAGQKLGWVSEESGLAAGGDAN